MTLTTTTEEIKAANSAVVHDLKFESLQSFVEDTSIRDIIPAIGRSTYIIIGSGVGEAFDIARQLAKRAEANLAVASYVSFGSVKLSENGAMVYQDDRNRIASDKKVSYLCNQSRVDGYRALDYLLAHLETDRILFSDYHAGDERKAHLSGFLNTTFEFNEAVYIDNNPLLIRSLKTFIREAETEHILPLLGDDFADSLHNKYLSGTCNDTEKQLLKLMARVIAHYAIAEAIPYQAIALDTNGIFTNPETQQQANKNSLGMAMTAALATGNKNLDRLRKFISKNKDALTGINELTLNSRSTLNDAPRGFFFA
jgi:hypothetical protein